jgi:ketosteroid isomerase-like protein
VKDGAWAMATPATNNRTNSGTNSRIVNTLTWAFWSGASDMNPFETVLAFFDAINERDPDKLAALMTQDHVFIDSLGNSVLGREKMRVGWRAYFAMCLDYRASHEDIFHNGNIVAAFGSAGGTIDKTKWQTPAAWRAVVRDGLVQEFRVYADNKPVYDILTKSSR